MKNSGAGKMMEHHGIINEDENKDAFAGIGLCACSLYGIIILLGRSLQNVICVEILR